MFRVIFHHPLPLNPDATSASGIRPLKMLAAFRAAGCEVDVIAGYSAERRAAIKTVKAKIRGGVKYAFVYSESSTMPTVLTDPHHLPLHPLLDFGFFRFCKKKNIPIGLFYRDIYWLFENYGKGLNPLKTAVAKACYRFDLLNYKRYLTKLYLPSLEMGRYVPTVPPGRFSALPPAHEMGQASRKTSAVQHTDKPLSIFYVGGMSDHYQMHQLFRVVSRRSDVELTLCTRAAEWEAVRDEYPPLTANIRVVHESGDAMQARLAATDVVSIFVQPQEYWEFAAPVKLYEYLGHGKPIIASEGTLAGRFVADNGIGWAIPYREDALDTLLDTLFSDPQALDATKRHMTSVARCHTWQVRVEHVIKDLTL
jgi:glycosyltransferase involved in cell wall biosynthesis